MSLTTRRYFANNAPAQTLAASVNSSATSIVVSSGYAGWPATFPFYATIDINTATAEIVQVTAIAGTTATVVRGQDGTSAVSHPAGATFLPTGIAKDLDEANVHTSSSAGVHNVSGHVVGDSDVQTITNKIFDSTNTFNAITSHGRTTVQPTATAVDVLRVMSVDGTTETLKVSDSGDVVNLGNTTTSGNLIVTGAATVGGTVTLQGSVSIAGNLTDKRSLKVAGSSALVFDNANGNTIPLTGDLSWHVVTGSWDTTTLDVGDLVDHKGSDGSMGVVTPGLYAWHILTDVPTLSAGNALALGVTKNQAISPTPLEHSWVDISGRASVNGHVICGANDRVNVVISANWGSSKNIIPIRFSLVLVAASN